MSTVALTSETFEDALTQQGITRRAGELRDELPRAGTHDGQIPQ